ncbi:MAG TPA: cytochrome c3 family protein [Anaerolineales bacterium]|nr:cytochrome c3 family protein [Anaerolineales bacterium]
MRKSLTRLFYGLLFAVPLMLLTYALAQASPVGQESAPAESAQGQDCQSCHPAFQNAWENGMHGTSGSNAAFVKSWKDQGEPEECLACHVTGYDPETKTWAADGITCESCHQPIPANHPLEPMPVDRSSQTCGNCHKETFFQWQASVHRQNDLDCSACHDPHSNSLKADTSDALCASCHKARSSNFTHSEHSQKGLVCADCHMGKVAEDVTQGHASRDHSYFVNLNTCTSCHQYQMHDPVAVHSGEVAAEPVDPMASVETLSVVATPLPVSPLGFALLAGLVGLAAGVVIAPWLERFQNKKDDWNQGE